MQASKMFSIYVCTNVIFQSVVNRNTFWRILVPHTSSAHTNAGPNKVKSQGAAVLSHLAVVCIGDLNPSVLDFG